MRALHVMYELGIGLVLGILLYYAIDRLILNGVGGVLFRYAGY